MVRITGIRPGDGPAPPRDAGVVRARTESAVLGLDERPHARHTRGVQNASLVIDAPAGPGPLTLSRAGARLDRLRNDALAAHADIERLRTILGPEALGQFSTARTQLPWLRDQVQRTERELTRATEDTPNGRWMRGRGLDREPRERYDRALADLRAAEAIITATRQRTGDLDPERAVTNADAVLRTFEEVGASLTTAIRESRDSPEAERLVFADNLFGRTLAAFDAGRALALVTRGNDIFLQAATGSQAAPLNALAAAIEVYGARVWPQITEHRVIERLVGVQRDLIGDWEGLYRHRFHLTPDGSALEPTSADAFNRLVSPEDLTFYYHGNIGVMAPLRALMRLPQGSARDEMVARFREHDLADVLFRRLAIHMSDGGSGNLRTMGSSAWVPVGEGLNELHSHVPELRDTFHARRYSVRLPEEHDRLPPTWSIADWVRANHDWDSPFYTYDGMHKGANVRAFQELARSI